MIRCKRNAIGFTVLMAAEFFGPLVDAQVREVWVARYDGPAHLTDRGMALAIDRQGSVCVTGHVGVDYSGSNRFDYVTIKYGAHGGPLWVRTYDGPGQRADTARDVAVDTQDNFYVTGESIGADGYHDYATLKYAPDGNQKWVRRYDGPNHRWDLAVAVALDNAGHVYVTGRSDPDTGPDNDDYLTLRYSQLTGDELWSHRWDSPTHVYDEPFAIAIDKGDNVYVTGWSWYDTPWVYNINTIKYGPAGNVEWVARAPVGGGGDQWWGNAIAVDDVGNVYVGGGMHVSLRPPSDTSYLILKYGRDGNLLWERHYDGPGAGGDNVTALALDIAGNAYVTGVSLGAGTDYDFATVKLDVDGNQLWVARYDGADHLYDRAVALALDDSGNVYVTGDSRGSQTLNDYATVLYRPDGKLAWIMRYDGPASSSDSAKALAVTAGGDVYVTGSSSGPTPDDVDIATIKYSQGRAGDLNCDGMVDFGDINPFVLALADPDEYKRQYPDCDINLADCNGDGKVDFGDINPFVELLSGE